MNDMYVHQLETENKQLREALQQTRKVLEEQTKTIDKAIEYINNKDNWYEDVGIITKVYIEKEKLLEILGDEE